MFCWHLIDLLVLLAHDGSVCFAGWPSQSVVKAGSNLVSANKTSVWTDMTASDKVRSATSLLVAMETATVAMAEELDEPTTILTKDENVGEKAGVFCLRLFVCLLWSSQSNRSRSRSSNNRNATTRTATANKRTSNKQATNTHPNTHTHARAHTHTHVCTHTRTHARSYTHTHARTHARTHAHAHTHTPSAGVEGGREEGRGEEMRAMGVSGIREAENCRFMLKCQSKRSV